MVQAEEPIVRMVNIRKRFGHVEALKGVDCNVHIGEILALVGDNGAGKSTFVKILAGVFPPTEGEMYFMGKLTHWSEPSESRAAGIEMLYQDLGLVQQLSMTRNYFLGKEHTTVPFVDWLDLKRMDAETVNGVKELGITIRDPRDLVFGLSGGEQKAVAIARSLYFGVRVLIFDEPTAALSVKETKKVLDVLSSIRERNIAVVVITHNIHHAYSIADRFVVLAAGRKLMDVEKRETSAEQLIAVMLGEAQPHQ